MKEITKFEAYDGKVFETEAECVEYEQSRPELALVGLTADDVEAALARTNIPLANAIESLGARIAKARVKSGERRRAPKGTATEPAANLAQPWEAPS